MIKTALVGMMVLGASFSLTGCLFGCDPGNNSQRAPITFTPSSSEATHSCSTYTMKLLGDTTTLPSTLVEVDIADSVAIGQDVPLWMNDTGNAAHSSDDKIAFSIQASSNLDDAASLTSVVVTPNALPTADGEPMAVELQLTFADGRVLDQVYTVPVTQGQCGI